MLRVNALAGTGKTTTAVFGAGAKVPKGMKVSDEQKAIIEEMRSYKAGSIAATAFNVSIVDELKGRMPLHCDVRTSNSFGNALIGLSHGVKRRQVSNKKNGDIFFKISDGKLSKGRQMEMFPIVVKYMDLCKCFLMKGDDPSDLDYLSDRFGIDKDMEIYQYVQDAMKVGNTMTDYIDFNDQIYLPWFYGMKVPTYDMVIVDEAQDLNRAKQWLALEMSKGGQLVIIGDPNQAIYGFSGADSESMDTVWSQMLDRDPASTTLPLTITRRCPKVVVELAKKYVPEFKYHKDAPDGLILHTPEKEFLDDLFIEEGSRMVLCRTNAPLMQLGFKLIAGRRRCFIMGKDIGAGLKTDISKTKETDLARAVDKACDTLKEKYVRECDLRRGDPNKAEALLDRIQCIRMIYENLGVNPTISDYNNYIESMFKHSGGPNDIMLSTVHKAKGLEHEHVSIIHPSKLPLPLKKAKPFQIQQEKNLTYVAYTRTKHTLEFVKEEEQRIEK